MQWKTLNSVSREAGLQSFGENGSKPDWVTVDLQIFGSLPLLNSPLFAFALGYQKFWGLSKNPSGIYFIYLAYLFSIWIYVYLCPHMTYVHICHVDMAYMDLFGLWHIWTYGKSGSLRWDHNHPGTCPQMFQSPLQAQSLRWPLLPLTDSHNTEWLRRGEGCLHTVVKLPAKHKCFAPHLATLQHQSHMQLGPSSLLPMGLLLSTIRRRF